MGVIPLAAQADDLNIIDFYRDTARTLVALYTAFPRKIDLYVEDIAGEDQPDAFGLHSKRHMACLGALLWLADEGYLRYDSQIRQEGIDQAVLSRTTLVTLTTSTPSEPLIYAIQKALQSGSSAQLIDTMQRALAS